MIQNKVQVVVFCKDEVLLLQTNRRRGQFWQNVTGSLEKGENFSAAARREMLEETGLHPAKLFDTNLSYIFRSRWNGGEVQEHVFAAIVNCKRPVILDNHEHVTYKWKKIKSIVEKDYKYFSNYEALMRGMLFL